MEISVDFLVIGGGMAGLTAAASATRQGASVMLIDKAPQVGGSALLSAGGLVRPESVSELVSRNPGADASLIALLGRHYDELIAWIRSLDVHITDVDRADEVLGFPALVRGHDVGRYVARCQAVIESAGNFLMTGCVTDELLTDAGRVVGARAHDRDGSATIVSRWTLLATGGYQNDRALRREFLGDNAADMLVRSNPVSSGDGLRLGRSTGATTVDAMDGFYGHTAPAPLTNPFTPADYVRFAQFYLNTRGLLLDRAGTRFADESAGYYHNASALLAQPGARALLVGDQQLRDEDAQGGMPSRTLGYERLDRIDEAKAAGARVAEADTLSRLEEAVSEWGYENVAEAVSRFNESIRSGAEIHPPRGRNRRPIDQGPYFAVEIQPAITFPFGGLRIDSQCRVIGSDGAPVPGLLAAGADVGGYYYEQYSGGLAMAGVHGLRAAHTATGTDTGLQWISA